MWEVYSHSIFVDRCAAGMQSTRGTLNAFLLIPWSFSRQANVLHELSFSRSWNRRQGGFIYLALHASPAAQSRRQCLMQELGPQSQTKLNLGRCLVLQ